MGDSQKNNSWSPDETRLLIQLLVEAVNNNWRDSNGSFSKFTIETKILPEINKDKDVVVRPKNYNHYRSRHKYLKALYQSCMELKRFSSGFGWSPQTKRFMADDEVWDDFLKAHPKNKNLRNDTFEFFEELQIIFGDGTATGKNSLGLGDGTDARTSYKVGENSNEYVDELDMYEVNPTPQQHDSSEEFFGSLDSLPTSECRTEKLQPKKRARSEGTSQKAENPMTIVSNQILTLIQQREERQQKEVGQKKNVWDAIKEISDLDERIRFKAVTKIYNLGMQDVFVSMSVEERLGWIQTSME